MPKIDTVRRIDNRTNGKLHAAPAGAVYSSDGMADTLDGYDASKTPGPNLIPVSRSDGTLDPGWLGAQAAAGEGASPIGGQVYIAPWVRLAKAISSTDTTILVTGPIAAVGDHGILGHYLYGNESVTFIGGPVAVGGLYEYQIERAAAARAYPAGATAIFNLGGATGGFITMVSGDQQQDLNPPHINLWAYEDGTAVRKVRLGLLSGLSAGEKALFPTVTNWNRYSLFAEDAFLKGLVIADEGELRNLDITGTLRVRSGVGEAGVTLGTAESGYGLNLLNEEGRPVFAAVSPYEDSDVAVFFDDGHGEKDFYYHKVGDRYKLEVKVDTLIDGTLEANNILIGTGTYPGAFVGLHLGKETGFTGYGTDFAKHVAWDARDGKLSFGGQLVGGWEGWLGRNGMTIDARQYDSAKPLMEHAVRWLHNSDYAGAPNEFVGATLGSATGWLAGSVVRYVSDVTGLPQPAGEENAQYRAGWQFFAGGASTLYGQAMNIIADSYLSVTAGAGDTTWFRKDRIETAGVNVANGLIYSDVTDTGSFVGFGTSTPTGARIVAEADTMAQVRAQHSAGAFLALTATAAREGWISANGAIVLAPNVGGSAPNYVLPPSATRKVSIGSLARPFEDVYARHGHFGTLGSQSALTDSLYLTRSAPALAANLEADNELAYFEASDLLPGAYIRFQDTDTNAVEVIAITSTGRWAMVEENEAWEYDVYRAAAGTAQLWYAGTVGVHLGGNDTDGYVRLVGLDDNNAAIGPALVVYQRDNGEAAANVSERMVAGNLNTFYDYTDPIYGFAAGRPAGSWVAMDEFNGMRWMYGTTQLARYREDILLGSEGGNNVHITNSSLALRVGDTAYIEMDNSGDMDLTGTLAMGVSGSITWSEGRIDATGIYITTLLEADTEDANALNFVYGGNVIANLVSFITPIGQSGDIVYTELTGKGIADKNTVVTIRSHALENDECFVSIMAYRDNAIATPEIYLYSFGSTTGINFYGGNVGLDNNRITDVGDPVNDQDAATKIYVDSSSGKTWRTWFGA